MKTNLKITLVATLISISMACKKSEPGTRSELQESQQMQSISKSTNVKVQALKFTKDPDVDLALILQTEQQGIVDIANVELASGNDAFLKDKARQFIANNQQMLQLVAAYLKNHPAVVQNLQFDALVLLNKNGALTQADLTGKIDYDFASLMLGLYQSGVDIAKLELAYGHQEDLLKLANKITQEHQTEVKELKAWLLAHQG